MTRTKKAPTRRDVRGAPRVQDMIAAARAQDAKNKAEGLSPRVQSDPTAADVIAAIGQSKQKK